MAFIDITNIRQPASTFHFVSKPPAAFSVPTSTTSRFNTSASHPHPHPHPTSNNDLVTGKDVYKLKNVLGQGTQGTVWEAWSTYKCMPVVIKRMHAGNAHPAWASAFRNEIEILERCAGHPNIVQILDRTAEFTQIVMEKAEISLKNRIHDMSSVLIDLSVCRGWAQEILTGVAYLHNCGIVHTDLKPENILLSKNHVKICDFGHSQRMMSSNVVGELSTLWYRAPELFRNGNHYDEKIDEWSVGCILLELLSGKPTYITLGSQPTRDQIERTCVMSLNAKRTMLEKPDRAGHVQKAYLSSNEWARAICGLLEVSPRNRSSCNEVLHLPVCII